MVLDLSSLKDALLQLEKGILEYKENQSSELLRDGVIQRFEYSHELAMKFMKRTLEVIFNDSIDPMSFNDVLRTAAERGLIDSVEQWMHYRNARNKTSHTYNGTIAIDVYAQVEPFLQSAQFLLSSLERAIAHS
jgi:nucleotidyltransferase substrate binding protein (TIGR01987 family)